MTLRFELDGYCDLIVGKIWCSEQCAGRTQGSVAWEWQGRLWSSQQCTIHDLFPVRVNAIKMAKSKADIIRQVEIA